WVRMAVGGLTATWNRLEAEQGRAMLVLFILFLFLASRKIIGFAHSGSRLLSLPPPPVSSHLD
ncbi:hypothetical protein PRIPAC_95156, partial [Pristionchus pacificus]|uniref:Uncharacterized protein n=1 Tax=Pristionchus pacificus TaxID=54126 RepID=A0A2A6BCJ4_PRIPA